MRFLEQNEIARLSYDLMHSMVKLAQMCGWKKAKA
jgi:hypothetical protein